MCQKLIVNANVLRGGAFVLFYLLVGWLVLF